MKDEVSVDDQGQARRVTVHVTLPTGAVTLQQDLYDFGVAVDVQPPPADQVSEAPTSTCTDSAPDANGLVASRCQATVTGSTTTGSSITREQKQQTCVLFTKSFAEITKTHPEQKASLQKALEQACAS